MARMNGWFVHPNRRNHAVCLCLLTLAGAPPAGMLEAQAPPLRGVVVDSTNREPIGGAIVTVLDAAGNPLRHTLSAGDGAFSVAGPAPGERVRFRRIGFRPREVRMDVATVTRTGTLQVALARIPQVLDPVRVREASLCPGNDDGGTASMLWGQARDGLLASIVARDATPARSEVLMYERARAPHDARVLRHEQRIRTGRTTRAFRAAGSAADFAIRGYVHEDASGRMFNAPDADVLLDPAFAATHCFRVVAGGPSRPHQIGLAFDPARRRGDIVDVAGLVWVDRNEPAVRELEFHYTGLDRASTTAGAGGTVQFETMPNGVVLITRWSLRMPVLAERRVASVQTSSDPPGSVGGGWGTRTERRELAVIEIRESGGMVMAATWEDGVRWHQPTAEVRGTILDRGSGVPMRQALVTLAGGSDTTATDSLGRFVLSPVLAGRYDLLAIDTSFAGYGDGHGSARETVDVPPFGTVNRTLQLVSATDRLRRICPAEQMRPQASILLGRIRRADGEPVDGVELRAVWQADFVPSQGASGASMAVREAQQTVAPDDSGRFYVCGVARERPIWLTLRRDGRSIGDTAVFVYDTILHRVELVIPPVQPPDPLVAGRLLSSSANPARGRALARRKMNER
jgi:hypothetical protein